MSAATPIAVMLGIDTSSRQIATGFEFRGQKFYWCAPTPNQPEALLFGCDQFCWFDDSDGQDVHAALADFLLNGAGVNDCPTQTILEARAAIAAQGGAE